MDESVNFSGAMPHLIAVATINAPVSAVVTERLKSSAAILCSGLAWCRRDDPERS